jgi:hypothetical protein
MSFKSVQKKNVVESTDYPLTCVTSFPKQSWRYCQHNKQKTETKRQTDLIRIQLYYSRIPCIKEVLLQVKETFFAFNIPIA